jgi:3-phosphoshikimate 1-carboxyvinyltransferase
MPSDKSIGHRALIANAIAEGEAVVELMAPGEDLLATVRCLQDLGVDVRTEGSANRSCRLAAVGSTAGTPERRCAFSPA